MGKIGSKGKLKKITFKNSNNTTINYHCIYNASCLVFKQCLTTPVYLVSIIQLCKLVSHEIVCFKMSKVRDSWLKVDCLCNGINCKIYKTYCGRIYMEIHFLIVRRADFISKHNIACKFKPVHDNS